jgi:cell division protein FtsB
MKLLAVVLAAGLASATFFGIYQLQQSNALSSRIVDAEQNVKDKDARIAALHSQILSLSSREKSLEADAAYWKDQYDSQSTSYVDLTDKYSKLQQENSQLVGENTSLKSSRTLLQDMIDASRAKLEAAQNNLAASPKPPYTVMWGREIKWVFQDSKGNLYHWQMPVDTYREVIEAPQPQDMLHLKKSDGTTVEVRDHTKFVDDHSFKGIIDQVYANSKDDKDFLYELWYITSQMTTYSADIGEQPRWALETFTEAGGDCEDTAILIASMIKSSSHTKDWEVQMVFFDLDHPGKAQDVNHVALYVKTKDFSTFVESTDKKDGLNFWQGKIDGWYFDV